jgi:putative toxin-antitoxin system antitoxin component (TIGR02293 family)
VANLKTPKRSRARTFISHRSTRKSLRAQFKALVAEDLPTGVKVDAIRTGIDARVINDMADYFAVSKSEIFAVLLTPASTTHRLIKERRPLDPAASERVVRVAEITRIAEETFGGPAAAGQWLKTPNLALENATPLSMLDTEPGANDVRRILASIDYGGVV